MQNPLSSASLLSAIAVVLTFQGSGVPSQAVDLGTQKKQRLKDAAADFWIYDDVARGYAEAEASGKPLLVSFRCVP